MNSMYKDHTIFTSRRELRRLDRREAILAVAARSFLEQGYAGTTMSNVAATLGGSKGTLWRYFASKEELFAAVIDQSTTTYRARLLEILDDPCGDVVMTLTRLCTSIVERITAPDAVALQRLVMAEAGRFPEMGVIFYDRAPRQTHALVASFLEGAMEQGHLRPDEPLKAARLLVSLCLSGYQQKMMMGVVKTASADVIASDIDEAINVFMRAYTLQ